MMKKLSLLISKDRIIELQSNTKKEILKELVDIIAGAPEVTDKDKFYLAVIKREEILSTGIGIGLAVPHVKIDSVKDFVIAIGIKRDGVDFDSLDGTPVYLVIMIGANTKQNEEYLKLLAKICLLFKNTELREKILKLPGIKEIYSLLQRHLATM